MWAQIFVHALLFNLSLVACQIIFDSHEEHNIEDPASVKLWRLLPKRHTNRRSLSLPFSRSTRKRSTQENISTQPSPTLPVPRTSIEQADELSRTWETGAIIFEEADRRDTVLPVKLSKCLPSETRFGTNYQCVGILTQGPCPIGKWVIINESTREPECADRPPECEAVKSEKTERCAQAALRMKQTTDTETIETCDYGKGMTLAFTKSGDVVCECRRGFLYWEAGDQCFEAYNKGPCGNGEYIGLVQATESDDLTTTVTTTKMPTTEAYQPPKPSSQVQEIPLARRTKTKRQIEIPDGVVQSTKRQKEIASTSVVMVKVPMTTSTEGSLPPVVDDDLAQIPDDVHVTTATDTGKDQVTPATGEARQGNDEQHLFDVKCIVNSCPEGLIPINLNVLARSPGSNVTRNADELNNSDTGATIILGHDQSLIVTEEPQDSIVCDKIGGQRDCLANYALSINPDSLEPECVALDDRSVFSSVVPIRFCANGIYQYESCIQVRRRTRFGG